MTDFNFYKELANTENKIFIMIPDNIKKSKLLTWTEKAVLMQLALFGYETGKIYPSYNQIAEEVGLSKQSVIEIIKSLTKKKLIEIKNPQGKDLLKHYHNNYKLLPDNKLFTIKTKVSDPVKHLDQLVKHLDSQVIDNEKNNKTAVSKETAEGAVHPVAAACEAPLAKLRKKRCIVDATPALVQKQKACRHEVPLTRISPPIEDIMQYWLELGLHKHPAADTKSFRNCPKKIKCLLRGAYWGKKFTVEEIKKTIHNFYLAACDEKFEPSNPEKKKYLRSLNISTFILNEFGTNGNSSLFKQYCNSPPKPTNEIITSVKPNITERIKRSYLQKATGGVRPVKFSVSDENCFALAANKIVEWAEENEHRLNMYMFSGGLYNDLSDMLIAAIDKEMNEDWSKVTPSWLCSKRTFDWRLPAYLYKQAAITEERPQYYNPLDYEEDEVVYDLCDSE